MKGMKKTVTLPMLLIFFLLCGCGQGETDNSDTRFLLDTVVTITADCDEETLNGAFLLCEEYEKLLSRTVKSSDVYRLNNSDGVITVSDDTANIITRAIYYSNISGGKFDITVYPLSSIWDFKNQIVPSKDEISAALKNIDYQSIKFNKNQVDLGGKKIDLGGIAKGYIADKITEYLADKGVGNALVNLGGNISMIGEHNIGIKKPFEDEVLLGVELENKSIVTSGIDQRYIKKGDKLYHHILDPDTGYGVENNLASVTVIGKSSLDCDALSTVCMLLGEENALKLINSTENTEAVFIDRDNKVTITDGIYVENDKIYFKEVVA